MNNDHDDLNLSNVAMERREAGIKEPQEKPMRDADETIDRILCERYERLFREAVAELERLRNLKPITHRNQLDDMKIETAREKMLTAKIKWDAAIMQQSLGRAQ